MAVEPSSLAGRLLAMHDPRKKPLPAQSFRTRARTMPPQCRRPPRPRHARDFRPRRRGASVAKCPRADASMIAALVTQGMATITAEKVRADGKLVAVAKVRITGAGRDVLAAES
jgi:hypothetical protein